MGAKQSKSAAPLRCSRQHPLTLATRNYICDICSASHQGISLHCASCDFDACPSHFLAAFGAKAQQDHGSINVKKLRCPKDHSLSIEVRAVPWMCDRCGASRLAGEISATCRGCDYDECPTHRIISTITALNEQELSPSELNAAKLRELLHAINQAPSSKVASLRSSSVKDVDFSSAAPIVNRSLPLHRPRDGWGITSAQWTKPDIYEAPYVSITDDEHAKLVFVQSCEMDVSICPFSARCTVTLTFANNSSKALEGEVVFPLPEEAVVNAYSLEVNGEMVSASLVEAKRAEKIYEAEVKKGVDPGLLQKVAAGGNAFKTRVYPLPAHGTRRLSLTYTQPLDSLDAAHGAVSLSLAFKQPVQMVLTGHILSNDGGAPLLDPSCTPCEGATIQRDAERPGVFRLNYVNKSHTAANAALVRVVVPLPEPDMPSILSEQATDGSGWYFAISDVTPPSMRSDAQRNRIAIVWDASLSREGEARKDGEVTVLLKVLEQVDAASTVIDVFIVRNTVELVADLKPADVASLIAATPFDGATALRDLEATLAPRISQYDRILLFSDGQSTVGDGRVPCIETGVAPPVYCITGSARINMSHLQHYWACCTGGALLQVGRQSVDDIVAAVFSRSPKILSIKGCVQYNPLSVKSIAGSPRFLVTGFVPSSTLLDANGSVTISVAVGFSRELHEVRAYTVHVASAVTANVVQVLWAQQRVAELEVFPEVNHEEILSVGRQFNVVTASSSLLVLETLAQHLEYSVVPHPSRKQMHADYLAHVGQLVVSEEKRVAAKLSTVTSYWRVRREWYARDFDVERQEESKNKKKKAEEAQSARLSGAPPAPPPAQAMNDVMSANIDRMMERGECLDRLSEQSAQLSDQAECFAMARESSAPRAARRMCPSNSSAPGGGGAGGGEIGGGAQQQRSANAVVKYWSPDTPYLAAIKAGATTAEQYQFYLAQRPEYSSIPAFYFDVAGFFLNPEIISQERRLIGIRILSNIAELALDNSRVLRVMGYKLFEAKEWELASEVFCRVGLWRPDEPQSYRDLGLTLIERGWYQNALELLWRTVTMEVPSSFAEIEVEALWEIRDCLARARRGNFVIDLPPLLKEHESVFLAGDMPLDLRVTMGWDQDNVDLDLHVIEPSGEEAYYGHQRTVAGGLMSRDFRQGYGPESYVVKKAMRGLYRFKTNHFASHMPSLTGPTVAILTITTNFLRPSQSTVCTLIRLNEPKDNGEIGSVTID